ncbi:DegT/DnrJ/EryC1/StrS family aminotransferase [Megalodesulfovibrio gigas]|uniref:DegT/DnrJ/EryC1/StrS family aminotransferase n=1 Tax=Megalodesulfovibrio gigas TaxID=879 RepID=UPI000687D819|nr:DegT/DnrJ/EryC1/StrS family aminotransferase [Megalodesulfovibrio gigas]
MAMMNLDVFSQQLLRFYDTCLSEHGDTARGAGWPNETDRGRRFRIGCEIIAQFGGGDSVTVCDLGCGTGELYGHIVRNGLDNISYTGVDLSSAALQYATEKFPAANFLQLDVLQCSDELLQAINCDFIFANGLFTVKNSASHATMFRFMTATLERVWPKARRGIIFNVMSKVVDWEREDLFHVSYDELAEYLHRLAGRFIGFRADYGLYELMAYAVKPGAASRQAVCRPIPPQAAWIPVFRPALPTAERLAPFLAIIDQTRQYSNYGGLVGRFAKRLSETLGLGADGVRPAVSGTLALLGAILASAGRASPDRPLALCPAHTFVATANAAEMAGYQPYFVDVDVNSWLFEPAMARNHPALDRVGLVLAVAPYGQGVEQAAWAAFSRDTGIPVVIDGAATFERLAAFPGELVGQVPVALSLHATKTFSTGEGGAVVCADRGLLDRATAALNFGFNGERISSMPGTNGKMSEYHAAVGLAALEAWPETQAAFDKAAYTYRRQAEAAGCGDRVVTAPRIASCYTLYHARDAVEAAAVENALHAARIEYRHWYGPGLHLEPAFRSAPRDELPNTEQLGRCLIGLPMAPDLSTQEIFRIVAALDAGLRGISGHDEEGNNG